MVDAGMNDLIRPALYGAYHKIENLTAYYEDENKRKGRVYDVVGPVCESADTFGTQRVLVKSYRGDLTPSARRRLRSGHGLALQRSPFAGPFIPIGSRRTAPERLLRATVVSDA